MHKSVMTAQCDAQDGGNTALIPRRLNSVDISKNLVVIHGLLLQLMFLYSLLILSKSSRFFLSSMSLKTQQNCVYI